MTQKLELKSSEKEELRATLDKRNLEIEKRNMQLHMLGYEIDDEKSVLNQVNADGLIVNESDMEGVNSYWQERRDSLNDMFSFDAPQERALENAVSDLMNESGIAIEAQASNNTRILGVADSIDYTRAKQRANSKDRSCFDIPLTSAQEQDAMGNLLNAALQQPAPAAVAAPATGSKGS